MDFSNPESRIEAILQNMLGANNVLDPPKSRIEYLLQQILENGGGGGQSAIHVKGVTTTALTDGCDTNPITINGESYTAVDGDLVAYQNKEFLFNGTIWQELGDVSEVMTIIENILEDIAQEFDATASYAVDDYVLKDGVLYKCTTAHTGAWDANDFTATTISDEIADVADALDDIKDGTDIDSFGDVETALAGKQGTILHGALDASGGVDGDLYLKTVSSSNMDVCGTPTANTGDGYEISTNVSVYSNYEAYKAFGDGDGIGKNGMGDATLVYHVTSGKKFKPSVISLCNNFDVSGGFLTAKGYAYASTDGVNWDTLFSFFDLSTKNESISFDITTNKFYSYFKFQFGGSGGYPGIKNIVILGESDSEDDNRVDNVFYKQDGKWLKDAFAKKADLDAKQDALTFDNAPTENSSNPVKSGGVYTALAGKVDAVSGKGLSTNDYDNTEKAQVATNAEDISSLKSNLTTLGLTVQNGKLCAVYNN